MNRGRSHLDLGALSPPSYGYRFVGPKSQANSISITSKKSIVLPIRHIISHPRPELTEFGVQPLKEYGAIDGGSPALIQQQYLIQYEPSETATVLHNKISMFCKGRQKIHLFHQTKLVSYDCRGTWNDYEKMKQVLGELKIARILSGGAKGADQVAERYAKENNIPIEVFLPNWKEYWKAAGPIRNTQMVELADVIVAFWDGTSPGTKHTITRAKQFHKHVYIIR